MKRTLIMATLLGVLVSSCGSAEPIGSAATTAGTIASTITTESTATTETSAPADIRTLVVPRGPIPTIDGTIEPTEWAGAAITVMDDGTELLWLHADGSLYLGVLNDTIGAVNLVAAEDDEIRVLHSSAALGSASYERQEDGTWRLEHDFEWCCRSAADSDGRALLLAGEGWQASIGYSGTRGHIEYRLMLGTGELRVAVAYIYADGSDSIAYWPQDLPAAARESLYGVRQDREDFAVETWMLVVPAG